MSTSTDSQPGRVPRPPFGGTLRLSKPPPAKVAAMVEAIKVPPPPPPPVSVSSPKHGPAPTVTESATPKPLSKYAAKVQAEQAAKAAIENAPALAEAQRIAWRVADLALCREQFPDLFDAERPKALALHIHKPLGKVIGLKRAKRLLEWWTDWQPYVAAIAAGGQRYNLDGTEAGEISEQHRATAQAALGVELQPMEAAA